MQRFESDRGGAEEEGSVLEQGPAHSDLSAPDQLPPPRDDFSPGRCSKAGPGLQSGDDPGASQFGGDSESSQSVQ